MKRILFVVVAMATVLITTNVNAQDFKFGAKAGVNFANIRANNENPDYRVSFHFGLTAEYKLSEKFAIQPELLYSEQGAKVSTIIDYNGNEFEFNTTTQLDYLNIPFMFKYYVAKGFSLQAGPQLGILLRSNLKIIDDIPIDDFYSDLHVKSVNFGMNFGLGFQLTKRIFLDARYNWGLSNDSDIQEEDYKGEAYNDTFQISIGCTF